MTDALVISRKDATARGMSLYFTGERCARGHVAPRRVVNCNCVECERVRQAKVAERERLKPRGRPPGRPQEYAVMGQDIRELHVAWPDDGGARVELVTDPNWLIDGKPRVVRKIGWRACMCCKARFFSQHISGIRICEPCKSSSDPEYAQQFIKPNGSRRRAGANDLSRERPGSA